MCFFLSNFSVYASECLLPHITDQFEAHNFNWYNNSLMMALKIVPKHVVDCIFRVHISVQVTLAW